MLEVFIDVEAINEDHAIVKAMIKLVDDFKDGNIGFICLEIEDEK